VKAEIVRLGTTYGLMSRHTSFVAVEERETPVPGEIQLRKVPVMISTGWHGIGSAEDMLACAGSRADSAPRMLRGPLPSMPRSLKSRTAAFLQPPLPTPPAQPQPVPPEPLDRLVALQERDGSWDLTPELAAAVGRRWREVDKAFGEVMDDVERRARLLPSGGVASMLGQLLDFLEEFRTHRLKKDLLRRAFATALAVRWLDARVPDRRNEWDGVARKADEWLQRVPLGATFWLDAVEGSKLLP
jgi:hypothetical protein